MPYDPCPWCGEDRRLSVDPETGLCCRWDYEMAEAATDPDPDAYDDEHHVRRMAAFAGDTDDV